MSETVLSRHFRWMPVEASRSSLQNQVDTLTSRFLEEATDPKVLMAMTAGSFAYRIGRAAVLGCGELQALGLWRQPLSVALGFSSEVTAFEFTNRLQETFLNRSPITDHRSPNLWSWSGPGGWKEGFALSALTFGTLKGGGFFARDQNILLQHLFQSMSMVAGHQVAGIFKLAPKPEGSFAEQLLHAESTNLQLAAGVGLVHAVVPPLSAMERGLDFTSSSWNLPKLSSFFIPSVSFASGNPRLTRTKEVKGEMQLWMSEAKGDPSDPRESGIPTMVYPQRPVDQRNITSLAIELGVVVPPSEILTDLSKETQKAFRSKVMGLISKKEVASRLASPALESLRAFVIGAKVPETPLFDSLTLLIETGRERDLVAPPPDTTPTLTPVEPVAVPGDSLKISAPAGGSEKDVLLPSLGEVSAFSSPSSSPDRGEDAYGIGNGGVFVIASSDSLMRSGKKAPFLAVDTILNHMKKKGANLGESVLVADQVIREGGEGEETMASAARIHPDGTVETAIAGTVEVWILFNDQRSPSGALPFWTVGEDQMRSTLGASVIPLPQLVAQNQSPQMGEILYGKIPHPHSEGDSEPEHALTLTPGDGLLMMTEGLAKYYHHFHHQLDRLVSGQSSAEEIRRKIQEDAEARLKTLRWRRGLKLEGKGLSTLVRVRIPEGMPMEGDYIDSVGEVYDAPEGGNVTAFFGEEKNHTALVYLHRAPSPVPISPEEDTPVFDKKIPAEAMRDPAEESDPFAGTFDEELEESGDRSAALPPPPSEDPPESESVTGTLKFPSSLPPPESLEKVGEYLESATGYKTTIRYPVESFQEFVERYGHNFQPGGVFIHTESPLPTGAFLEMEILLKNGDLILRADGQVAGARRQNEAEPSLAPGMGIKFLLLEGESQSVLDAIVAGTKK